MSTENSQKHYSTASTMLLYKEVLWWVLPTRPGFHIIVLISVILYIVTLMSINFQPLLVERLSKISVKLELHGLIKAFDLTVYGYCVRFQIPYISSHTPTY